MSRTPRRDVARAYVAAPIAQCERARACASLLESNVDHLLIVSTWHDAAAANGVKLDPTDDDTRTLILDQNLRDLRSASFVVALCDRGTPRATNAEIGFALALSLPVLWVHDQIHNGRNIFDAHPLVTRLICFDGLYLPLDLESAVKRMVRQVRAA